MRETDVEDGPSREELVRSAVWRGVKEWLKVGPKVEPALIESTFECVFEMVWEVVAERESVVLCDGELEALLGDVLPDVGIDMAVYEVGELNERLERELMVVQSTIEEREGSDGEEGCCGLCERGMPLTRHHLIPRAVHKEYKRRGFSVQELSTTIAICRACHSAIHRIIGVKEMAAEYRSLEKLQNHAEISKFAQWNAKQKVRLRTTSKGGYMKH